MVNPELIRVTGSWLAKDMSVGNMRKVIATLPDEYRLVPNRVGNLTVVDVTDRVGRAYIGYVDFAEERLEVNDV